MTGPDGHPRPEEPVLITPSMLTAPPGRAPVDFERGMRYAPPLILFLILANLVMFVWEIAAGALSDRDAIIAAGALAHVASSIPRKP